MQGQILTSFCSA